VIVLSALMVVGPAQGEDGDGPVGSVSCKTFTLSFREDGRPASLRRLADGRELLDKKMPGEGFSIRPMNRDGTPAGPVQRLPRVTFPVPGRMVVSDEDGRKAVTFEVRARERHVAFRIRELEGFPSSETVKLSVNLRVKVHGIIGTATTTVRGADVAVGVQSLDYMTWSKVGGRGKSTDLRVEWGSLWHRTENDPLGGFALFVCDVERTLRTIGRIELDEGLPHPMHNGEWAKIANGVSRPAKPTKPWTTSTGRGCGCSISRSGCGRAPDYTR
jgi:hypothetical protein